MPSSRHARRCWALITVGLIIAVALVVDALALLHSPFAVIYPAAAVVATTIVAAAARDVDAATRKAAIIDQLTGAFNRVGLQSRIAEVTYLASWHGQPVSLIVGDIDHFKSINDTHGHAVGDTVLGEVARRLAACLDGLEPVYRLGGEEFLVVLAGVEAAEGARVAERLRIAIGQAPVGDLPVTMSFGVAGPTGEQFDYERVFAQADAALYASKGNGRDVVTVLEGASWPAGPSLEDRRNTAETVVRLADRRARVPRAEPAMAADAEVRPDRSAGVLDEDRDASGSWLVRDRVQRDHLLDHARRLHQINRPCYLLTFAVLIAAAPTYGWITVFPPLAAAIVYDVVERQLDRFHRPEYALGIIWLITQVANGVAAGRRTLPCPHGLPAGICDCR